MPSRGRRLGTAALLAVALSGTSCAHHIGKKASQGAIQAFKEKPPEEQPSRIIARRAIEGALDTLEDPEQQRRVRAMIDRAVDAAVARTLDALNDPRQQERMRELVTSVVDEATARTFQSAMGSEGGEPSPATQLAQQLAQVAAREVMREVVQGMGTGLDQIFPACGPGVDVRQCRQQHLRALTTETGASFAKGVLDVIRWPLLIATGMLGLVAGLLAHWLWTVRRRPPAGGPAPTAAGAVGRTSAITRPVTS